jgi:uncharacterized protein YjbI with pentapeptide repeats
MRATEVLKQYADGRRDFRGEDLIGQSFKGKNLSGANFSEADIRGANFTNAYLIGANFKGAKAGLQRRWSIFLVVASFLVATLSTFTSVSVAGILRVGIGNDLFEENALILGIVLLGLVSAFCLIAIRKGLTVGLGTLIVAVAGAATVALIGNSVAVLPKQASADWAKGMSGALGVAGLVVGTIAGATAVAGIAGKGLARTVIVAGACAGGVGGALVRILVRGGGGALSSQPGIWTWVWFDLFWGWAWAWTLTIIGCYMGWWLLSGDKQLALVQRIAIALAATGSTSFRNANLTDTDFTSATLKSTDFRNATLTRTRWHQAKMLDLVRPGTTFLQFPQVRQLLITGQGQAQNFDRQPLRGVNLQGANLADASFIGADLSEANLQDADLSRAKLMQTQLDETDLTGATLTGAYIEDWGITSHSKLHGVRCEYVFMRLPTKEDPNPRRKPDNWNETFKDGDFADFIKPIVDTLDLYHNQDVDPRAIAISFKELAEKHPEAELEIVAMEKRGGDKFMLKVATAPDANHSELNAEYFDTYNEIKALAPRELQALLAEKDSRISSLENMIATALQRPSFYAKTYHQVGDFMSESKGNISITSGDGSKISGVAGAGESMTGSAMADVSGTVTIAINELPDSSEPNKPGIKELLSQLQAAINDPNLADDDKAQALEQIKVIAEAGQNPNNETAQKQAKRAMGFLKVIAEGLPSAAQLVKTCQDILPAIAHFFGL